MYNKLILSGGGIKGCMYVGMIKYFEEQNIILDVLNMVIGTSIGAFVALLIILEYTSDELTKFIFSMDFDELKNPKLINLENNYGLDDGTKMNDLIRTLIKNKNFDPDITFEQLFKLTDIELVTSAYNVNTRRAVYFNKNDHSDMPVHLAVRMSMTIPVIFCAVEYKDHLYVDGGVISNIAIHYLIETVPKEKLDNIMKYTLCVGFDEVNFHDKTIITGFDSYLYNIFKSAFYAIEIQDKKYVRDNNYSLLTLKTSIKNGTSFKLSDDQKTELYTDGYNYTKKYIIQKNISDEKSNNIF